MTSSRQKSGGEGASGYKRSTGWSLEEHRASACGKVNRVSNRFWVQGGDPVPYPPFSKPISNCEQCVDIRKRHITGQDHIITCAAIEGVRQPIADQHVIARATRDRDAGIAAGNL